jgi:hypothetical protein
MICFFYVTKSVKITNKEHTLVFEGTQDKDQVALDKIYFSTPSDFYNQVNNLKKKTGEEVMFAVDSKMVSSLDGFPEHIGFGNLDQLEKFKGKSEVKIAIVNAMSNSIGDHLIGMQAFDYWHRKICELLAGTKVTVSLFQLNPYQLSDITRQWSDKIDHLYLLPNNVTKLMEQDAFVDLGTMLLREGFDTEPMIDFFFKALSVDPNSVLDKNKRIKYTVGDETATQIQEVMREVKSHLRPVLLFHHKSTTPIREIEDCRVKKIIEEIISKSEYFVISATSLSDQQDIDSSRFMDVSQYCPSLDHFAAIISQVDGIVTVDTCTYHLADAFSVPTIVLFSSIDPNLRIKYYPYVQAIMYESKDGRLFGKHKASTDEDELRKELEHLSTLWDKINVDEILEKLQNITKMKEEVML